VKAASNSKIIRKLHSLSGIQQYLFKFKITKNRLYENSALDLRMNNTKEMGQLQGESKAAGRN
jgi:hypothetical protein